MLASVQLKEITPLLENFLMCILRCSQRTLRRRMAAGLIAGAYRTKGGHWRIKKPSGVTKENLSQFLRSGAWRFPVENKSFPPALIAWCNRIQENESLFRDNHPFRRMQRQRIRAEAAQRQADEAGYYTLDDLENLGAI